MIAALYVERDGVYYGLPGVDPWPIDRDARRYPGPWPVVAHPPCERWGRYSTGSPLKGGLLTGDDDGCFSSALASLKAWGGVLEHPEGSKAWGVYGLQQPALTGWSYDEVNGLWVCRVEQGHYGHVARKATWLLVKSASKPQELIWGKSEQRLPAKRLAERGYESARRCGMVAMQSHLQRQRTPVPFCDLLICIARFCIGD